jgi:hypothetical protein
MPDPIYTVENTRIAFELRWSVTLFWKQPAPPADSWLALLQKATEADGVRVLEHRFPSDILSQFLISTKPHVAPAQCLRSVKGRLQHLVRADLPKAFRRTYSICSVGTANQNAIETYVASQLQNHPMADPRIEAMLLPYQFADDLLNLGTPRRSSHGEFVYNLQFVVVNQQRFAEVRDDYLRGAFEMLRAAASKNGHLLSRIGLLADHMHWTVGCDIEESPLEVGLSYLNNLAYAREMRPVFQYGFYTGTFGPYDMNAVRRKL